MFENDLEKSHRSHSLGLWILSLGMVLGLAGNVYQYVRSERLSGDLTANQRSTQQEIQKLTETASAAIQLDQQRFDQLKEQLNSSAAATLKQARSEVRRTSSQVSRDLDKAHQDVVQQLSSLKQETTAKLNDTSAKLNDTSVKVNDTSDRLDRVSDELGRTGSSVRQVVGDLGVVSGQVATNAKELAALRELGERNYFEFNLNKTSEPQKVGDIRLVLKKSDPKHNRYTLQVLADDKIVEKRDKTINEPVQLYVGGSRQPYEIVVNQVKKNQVVGYLSTPKAKLSRGGQTS
jgi:hypothetical protein